MTRKYFPAIALLACLLVGASAAYADTISIGFQQAGVSGGAIVTGTTSSSGLATFLGSYGSFDLSIVTAIGSPSVPEPTLASNTLDVSSSTAGILKVFITEQNLTFPMGISGFMSSFTANLIPAGWSITEQTFLDAGNGVYAMTTPLGSATFTGIGTSVQSTLSPLLSGQFSETEVFTINSNGFGVTNDTIEISQTPEPASLLLLGTGLLGLAGGIRRKFAAA